MHFLEFCADISQKPKSVKAIYNKVLFTVFQKTWFIEVSATIHELLAIKISKTMLIQQKFNKILRFQTLISSKSHNKTFQMHMFIAFSCEYWEISKNTCFEEHLHMAASEETLGKDCLGLSFWRVALKTILT